MNAGDPGSAPPSVPSRALVGRVLAQRYELRQQIAVGGMAEVWEADDLILGRAVAVKILHPQFANDPVVRQRFHIEAIAAARLVDPSIVAIYDTVDLDGCDAIVMELVRGRTLRDFLDERGALDPIEVVHIGAQVAGGSKQVFGLMVESHLNAGAQKFTPGKDDANALAYGKSITDACISWEDSLKLLEGLSQAVLARRGR